MIYYKMKSKSFQHVVVVLFLFLEMVFSKDCKDPIGIERGEIPDNKISASSSYDNLSPGARGRLNIKYEPPMKSGWCAGENNQEQYLEIDLEADSEITGIATQGRGREPYKHWVTKYYVSFRAAEGPWFNFTRTNEVEPQIFEGNTDAFTSVFHSFNRVIKARYVRVHPVEWNIQICMRVELYGCQGKKLVIKDDDLLIMFIILLLLAFCFVLLLLMLLLTMRRLLKLLERRVNEKLRVGIALRDNVDGEFKQGSLTHSNTSGTTSKENSKKEPPVYATIEKSKNKNDENDPKNNRKEKKSKDVADPKIVLVNADEEEEKRKSDENRSRREKIEMIDL